MKSVTKIGALVVVGLGGAAVSFLAGRAIAAGIPEADGMTYTGYLEDGDGQPLTGDHSIEVQFWASEDATDDLCSGQLDSVELQSGRFQVPLPIACSQAVQAAPDVWVSVDVDGASLGRTKLGSVPYALEAGHASRADQATNADEAAHAAVAADADGALDERIADLEAESPGQSGFRAISNGASAPNQSRFVTAFDQELFDLGGEFVPATGTFTTKQGGYYEIGCNFFFVTASSTPFFMEAGVMINGKLSDVGNITAGANNHQQVRAHGLHKLAANDQVQCGTYQSSGGAVAIRSTATFPNEPPSSFTAMRVKPL